MRDSINPLVSIIIPIYNGSLYLDYAVQSVLNQTYENWELFLVDDGSTDDSYSQALDWSKREERIHLVFHTNHYNKGVSATRNLGISHAKGHYLAFLDCDDEWYPDKLEKQVNIMLQYPKVVMTYCQSVMVNEQGTPLSYKELVAIGYPAIDGTGISGHPSNIAEHIITKKITATISSTSLIRAKYVENCGGFDETLQYQVEDAVLFVLLAEQGPVYFLQEVLAKYRYHMKSWSANLYSNRPKTYQAELSLYRTLLKRVHSKHRPLCYQELLKSIQELIEQWILHCVYVAYRSPGSTKQFFSWFLVIITNRNIHISDKIRCSFIVMRWVIWRFLRLPFKKK